MDSQIRLQGLNEPRRTLTPPAQLYNRIPAQNIAFDCPTPAPVNNTSRNNNTSSTANASTKVKSSLATLDSAEITNLASSAIAGGLAAVKTAHNAGIIGESIRGVHVQNAMSEMQMRMNQGMNGAMGGYGGGGYNSYGGTEYVRPTVGGTEYVRTVPRYGRVEMFGNGGYGGGYGRVEDMPLAGTPEMHMAIRNITSGAIQGLKYGSLIGGAVSSLTNMYKVVTGKEKGSEAVGSVVSDTVTSGVSGAVGAVAGGFASLGLGIAGIGGVPGIALAAGVGLIGAVGSQLLMQKSGIGEAIKNKVMSFFDKK